MSDETSPRKTTGRTIVVTVAQHKGGEGKTTITRMLGEFAAKAGYHTLLIDTDDQCSLSRRFLKMEENPADLQDTIPPVHPDWTPDEDPQLARTSIVSLYDGTGAWPYPVGQRDKDGGTNLWLIPSTGSALRALKEARRQDDIKEQLRKFLRHPDVQTEYDLVLIDTPPNKEKITLSAIRASTHMLIPTQLQSQSVEGLNGMLQAWRAEQRVRSDEDRIELIGILPNRTQNVALQQGILASMQQNIAIAPFLMETMIPLRTGIAEADHPRADPQSVFNLPENNDVRMVCESACTKVFQRIGLPVELTPRKESSSANKSAESSQTPAKKMSMAKRAKTK